MPCALQGNVPPGPLRSTLINTRVLLSIGQGMAIAYTQPCKGALSASPDRHRQLRRIFEKCDYIASLQQLMLIRPRGRHFVDPDALCRPTFIKPDCHVSPRHGGKAQPMAPAVQIDMPAA